MNGRIGFCPEPVATSLRVRSVWALLLLSLVVGFVFFAHLGGYPLFDVDEGAFAEATREMLASGDYGFPMLDGAPRFDKPILIYWLQAAAMALFGVDTWSARLPSAVAAVLWVFATWHFARHRFGARPALLAAAILATAIGPWAIGRAATADAWLNLWLALDRSPTGVAPPRPADSCLFVDGARLSHQGPRCGARSWSGSTPLLRGTTRMAQILGDAARPHRLAGVPCGRPSLVRLRVVA
jgi:hypothetical protein